MSHMVVWLQRCKAIQKIVGIMAQGISQSPRFYTVFIPSICQTIAEPFISMLCAF